jgi:zinc protease
MTRGTKSMTREQIKDALDKNLARLGTGMGGRMIRAFAGGLGVGSVTFTVETKRAKLPAVLEILRQILREPTLPGSEFEVLKNEEIAGIEQGLSDPMRQGLNRLLRLFSRPYPRDDVRYVPTLSERLERTRRLSLDQVRALYHGYLGAEHGELVMIGDFEPSEVLPILGKTFEGWKAEKPYARIERPFPPDLKPERDTIQTPDKANAIYVAGLQMPLKDSDPDYPALLAGNYVLGGGGLSSRLVDRLRQKGGLSYTAMSMLSADPFDAHAMLMILAIYNPSNVDKVATGVDEEVHRLLRDGVKPDELERAKKGYLQQQQVLRTNDTMLAVLLTEDLYVGRTLRFQADLEEKIQALTPAAVDAALRKYINPKQLSVVTAGDFSKTK